MTRLPKSLAAATLALFALGACETADQTAQSSETIQWNTPRPTDVTPAQPAPPAASPQQPAAPASPGEPECREYQTTIMIGGKPEKAYGRACRQPDGTWKQVGEHKPSASASASKVEQTYPYGWHGYEYPYGPRYAPSMSIGVGTGSRGGFMGYGVGF